MAKDRMRYDLLVEDALRGVARKALEHVRDEGLPGEHHFYLTFRADDPGTGVSEALRARHPDEITIVLQHQYWDLVVDDGGFAVTLSFEGVPERLEVPWGALTAFNDPSVQFSLQFQHRRMEGGGPAAAAPPAEQPPETPLADASGAPPKGQEKGEKIVTLDSFRKK